MLLFEELDGVDGIACTGAVLLDIGDDDLGADELCAELTHFKAVMEGGEWFAKGVLCAWGHPDLVDFACAKSPCRSEKVTKVWWVEAATKKSDPFGRVGHILVLYDRGCA